MWAKGLVIRIFSAAAKVAEARPSAKRSANAFARVAVIQSFSVPQLSVGPRQMNPLDKPFKIPREEIKELIPNIGACYATDRITLDGMKVGYMYRDQPNNDVDSGWRFFSGDESQEYADNPDNISIYAVNTICNYDQSIIPFLNAPIGSAFGRVEDTDEFKSE